jgi:hypothetical protein
MAQLNSTNPSKHIRKAVYNLVNSTYPCFDMQITGNKNPDTYVLMTSQSKTIDKANKCNYRWECSLSLDIITIYKGSGNTGSRLKGDDAESAIYELIKNITISGYTVVNRTFSFPDSLSLKTPTENIFRNFIRIELLLN